MRWPDLSRARRAVELDKIGTTTEFVLLDLQDAAKESRALQDELDRCKTDEERESLAFEWFEDHRQPTERSNWVGDWVFLTFDSPPPPTFQTPDWPGGWLPRLKDDEQTEAGDEQADADDLAGGDPYLKADYLAAGQLHARHKMTIQGIVKRTALKPGRAYRIYRQLNAGAVLCDGIGLRPGPGYRWDSLDLDDDPPRYRLLPG